MAASPEEEAALKAPGDEVTASWLEKAEAFKSKGNVFFGEKQYKKAIGQFARVRAYTWQPNGEAAQ